MVVFAFVGIELVGLTAGETENPQKVIPKAINQIPVRILLFYVGALFVIMCIYPWNVLNPNESPFVQVFCSRHRCGCQFDQFCCINISRISCK